MREFLERFNFRLGGKMLVGIERECFLINGSGKISPISPEVLKVLTDDVRFGYELSACQLEDRVGPCKIEDLRSALMANEVEIKKAEKKLGFTRSFAEVAPDDIPLDVFPDPTGRCQEIVKKMPSRVLLAACQVIGTHVHIGMPDHETALKVYSHAIKSFDELCRLGDLSDGKRLEIYRIVEKDLEPPQYSSWEDFYSESLERKFTDNPRDCWHIIRISVHGTIEFRMFGATHDIEVVNGWAEKCHEICNQAIKS